MNERDPIVVALTLALHEIAERRAAEQADRRRRMALVAETRRRQPRGEVA